MCRKQPYLSPHHVIFYHSTPFPKLAVNLEFSETPLTHQTLTLLLHAHSKWAAASQGRGSCVPTFPRSTQKQQNTSKQIYILHILGLKRIKYHGKVLCHANINIIFVVSHVFPPQTWNNLRMNMIILPIISPPSWFLHWPIIFFIIIGWFFIIFIVIVIVWRGLLFIAFIRHFNEKHFVYW